METNLKQRNGCITAWLWVAIIANIGMAIFYAVSMFSAYTTEMALGFGICSILGVVNILGAILLMRWNKTGFYLFLISSLITAIVSIFVLKMEAATAIGSLFAIIIWWAILQAKKNGVSAWSQLDTGWDYKHTRHLYQVFSIIGIALFVLTLIAVGMEHKNPYADILPDDSYLDEDSIAVEVVEEEVAVVDSVIAVAEEDVIVVEEPVRPLPAEEMPRKENPTPAPSKKKVVSEEHGDDSTSRQQAADQLLKIAIEQANNEFPQDTGVGMVVTRMYLSGNYVMYVAECDEDLISMDLLGQNKSSMLTELRKMVSDKSNAEIHQFVKICANAGKGIGYTYVGDTSGTKITVRITNEELKKLL